MSVRDGFPLATDSWDQREYDAINRVVRSGMYSMGKEVATFEAMFADAMGVRRAVMVNSGSSANLIIAAAHAIIDGIQETTLQAVVQEPPGIRRMVLAINGTIEGASRIRTHGVLLSSCMGRFPKLTDHVRPKLRADLRQGLQSGDILVRPSRMLDAQIGALVGLAIRARVFEWKVRNTTRTTAESILRLLGQSPDQAQKTVEEALG